MNLSCQEFFGEITNSDCLLTHDLLSYMTGLIFPKMIKKYYRNIVNLEIA